MMPMSRMKNTGASIANSRIAEPFVAFGVHA